MTTYERADADTVAQVAARAEDYYPDLTAAEVRFDVLLAYGTRKEGQIVTPAIRHHGYPALAVIRVLGTKDRAAGRADVELTIDGDHWIHMGEARRFALIDHELHHLALVWEDEERRVPKPDDNGRPRLKLRKHDFEIGGFHDIAKRHKAEAPEVVEVRRALGGIDVVQLYLPGMSAAA